MKSKAPGLGQAESKTANHGVRTQAHRDQAVISQSRSKSRPQQIPVAAGQKPTPWPLPEWLPQCVRKSARDIMARPAPFEQAIWKDLELRARFQRLTTDQRMRFVWRQLEAELTDFGVRNVAPEQKAVFVESWLRGYLYSAITADHDISFWNSAPGTQEQRAKMRRIHALASELSVLLDKPQINKWTPWNSLDAAVASFHNAPSSDQKLFHELAECTRGRYWARNEIGGGKFPQRARGNQHFSYFSLPAVALLGDLPSQLKGLVMLAKRGTEKSQVSSYRRTKSKHQRRLLYRNYLRRYFEGLGIRARPPKHRQGGFSLHKIIATTTNVALGLSGPDELSSDAARKSR